MTATGLPGSLFRIAANVFAYVLQRFFVARLNPHGRACSTALESLLVSYRPLALELSSSCARRNPLVLCLAGTREIRGLLGYAKYSRVFWKTLSRCRRAAGQHRSEVTSSGSSIPPFGRSHGRSLNEELYRGRSTTHRVVSGANSDVVYLPQFTSNTSRRVVGQWGGAGGAICEDHFALAASVRVAAAACKREKPVLLLLLFTRSDLDAT